MFQANLGYTVRGEPVKKRRKIKCRCERQLILNICFQMKTFRKPRSRGFVTLATSNRPFPRVSPSSVSVIPGVRQGGLFLWLSLTAFQHFLHVGAAVSYQPKIIPGISNSQKKLLSQVVVVHTFSPRTWEAEAGRSL